EPYRGGRSLGTEAIISPVGTPVAHEKSPTPSAVRHIAADQVREVPPLPLAHDDVEIVPFAPAHIGPEGNVKVIELVIQLRRGRPNPGRVARSVVPATRNHVQRSPDPLGTARNLGTDSRGDGAIAFAQIDQLVLDHRRYGADQPRAALPTEKLTGQK